MTKDVYDIVSLNKKRNAEYWDSMDEKTELFVKEIIGFGYHPKNEKSTQEPTELVSKDKITEIAKAILYQVTEELKTSGLEFPYVDEDM